jgi:site-specific DNA-methyltransferase (adenine-specific)
MPANKKADGINNKVLSKLNAFKSRNNIWEYAVGMGGTTSDKIAFKHPAVFPEKLAEEHIISWTNVGDIVFDPMAGSGTTLKMAAKNNRHFIGCDISEEYVEISRKRIKSIQQTLN